MVGDSPANDVGFGRAAGVSTALLDTGRRVREGGADGGADLVVDALARLPHAIFKHFEVRGERAAELTKYTTPRPSGEAALAAAEGDVAALAALPLAALEAADASGNTPLIWAANAGHAEAVREISPHYLPYISPMSPLHLPYSSPVSPYISLGARPRGAWRRWSQHARLPRRDGGGARQPRWAHRRTRRSA